LEFVTVTKEDPAFDSYLKGTFSRDHRALPIETYHPQTAKERVTFRILPLSQVAKPSWWKIYFWSSRPELLALTMGPALAAWLGHRDGIQDWARWPSWLALVGLFFLHTSVFLFNDVQDHLRGADRLNRRRGSQVIQKGWVRAVDMQWWAWFNGALAVAFGVPAFFNAPLGLLAVCGLALPALWVVVRGIGVQWGLADFALALLFGPLLTTGIGLASFAEVQLSDFLLGAVLGLLTVWTLQMRQLENLFRSRPEGFRTILGHLDFDRAKLFLFAGGLAILVAQFVVAWRLSVPMPWLFVLPLVGAPMALLMLRVHRAASPLSSSLIGCEWWALGSQLLWTLWWIVALGVQWL